MLGAPRVVRRTVAVVDARGPEGKLDRVRLAGEYHAGARHLADRSRVRVGDRALERLRTCGGGEAGDVEEILRGVRDAVERAKGLAAGKSSFRSEGSSEGALWRHEPEGV